MIKLDIQTQGGWHHFTGVFATEDQAIKYATARRSTHIVSEIEDAPIDDTHAALLAYLYPTCHHGMDGRQCLDPYGPHHFGTAEWERSMGF